MAELDCESIRSVRLLRRKLANDPASVAKRLRDSCDILGHTQHSTARDPLGVLVALFSSHMPSTVWTVLFQKLRESDSTKVKLSIFQHFAHICERIPAVQKRNAFCVFAQEVVVLLSKEEVVVNISFKNSFRLIVESLGMFSEKELCSQMLTIMIDNMQEWKKSDLLRSSALLSSSLVCFTSVYKTPIHFLHLTKRKLSLYAHSLVLDACTPLIIDRAQRLAENASSYSEFIHLLELLDEAMINCFLFNKMNFTQPIPSLISCFMRVKEFDSKFSLSEEANICHQVLLALEDTRTKKFLVSSLLGFLQKTRINWWKHVDIVFSYSLRDDAVTRSYAFLAIANAVEAIQAHEIFNIQPMLLDLCRSFSQQSCVITVCGILSVFKSSFSRLVSHKKVTEDLLFRLFSIIFEAPDELKHNSSIQLLVLDLIEICCAYSPSLLLYVTQRFDSNHVAVQKGALKTLLTWCTTQIIEESILESANLGVIDFFEKSWFCDAPEVAISLPSLYHTSQNFKILANFFLHRLSESFRDIRGKYVATENACTAICALVEFSKHHILMGDFPLMYISSSFEIITSNMLDYSGKMTLSTFIKLMRTSTACLGNSSSLQTISVSCHKHLFNLSCSIMFYCSQIIEPCVSYEFQSDICFYGAFVELPSDLRRAIQNAFLSSLHNTEPFKNTDFYAFIETTFDYLTRLTEIGICSRIFIAHIRKLHSSLLKCMNIFIETNSQSLFQFIKVFVKIAFVSLNEHVGNDFSKGDFLHILLAVKHYIIRGFSLDLFSIGSSFFDLIIILIDFDSHSNLACAYFLVDTDYSLVNNIINELLAGKSYVLHYGFDVVETLLRILLKLAKSPHKPSVALLLTPEKHNCIVKNLNCESNTSSSATLNACKEYLRLISSELKLSGEAIGGPLDALTAGIQGRMSPSTYFSLFEAFCGSKGVRVEIEHRLPYGWHQSPYFLILKAINDFRFIDKAIKVLSCTPCETWLRCLLVIVVIDYFSHSRLQSTASEDSSCKEPRIPKHVIYFLRNYNGQVCSTPVFDYNHIPTLNCAKRMGFKQCDNSWPYFDHGSHNFDVSFILSSMPYGTCALSASASELMVEDYLSDLLVTDMFECCNRENGLALFHILCNEGNLNKINTRGVVALAQCLMSTKAHKGDHVTLNSIAFAEHLEFLLDSVSSADSDFFKCFRYSTLFLIAFFYCNKVDCSASNNNVLLSNTPLCLKIVRHCGFRDAKDLENAVEAVLEKLSSPERLDSFEESTLLFLVRIFGGSFRWSEWLQSLLQHGTLEHFNTCLKVSQIVSFSFNIWLDIKEIFLSIFQPNELEPAGSTDRQRDSLWLLSSMLCHSENDSSAPGRNMFQTCFSDSCSDFSHFYRKGPLVGTASTLFNGIHEGMLPSFMKSNCSAWSRRNPHYRQRLLPLCGCLHPQTLRHTEERSAYVDLLQFYLKTVGAVFLRTHASSPGYFYDVMSSLSIICANGGISFKKSSWQTDSISFFVAFVHHLLEYLKDFELPTVDTSRQFGVSVLSEHTDLFLRPILSTKFCDTMGLVTVCKLLCCKTFQICNDGPFATDGLLSNLIQNLMSTNHFTYLAAHSCIGLLNSNPFVLKKMTWLLSYCSKQFIEDLQLVTSWGYLSFSVGAMQLLRTASVIAFSWPNDERLYSKICEGLWNYVLKVTLCRALTFKGYELLRVLVSNTSVGGRQWDMLQVLITDDWRDNCLTETREISAVWEANISFSDVETLPNLCASHETHLLSQSRFISEKGVLCRLLLSRVHAERLVTQAFLLLRNGENISNKETSEVFQSALISTLLDRCRTLNEAGLLCMEVLIVEAIAKNHYNVFFFLNHFKISSASHRVYMRVLLFVLYQHLLRVNNSGGNFVTTEMRNLLFNFLESAAHCIACMPLMVWLITALLTSLISFQSLKVSCAMALAILPPQPQCVCEMLSRALVKFFAQTPLRLFVMQLLNHMRETMNPGSTIAVQTNSYISNLLRYVDYD